MPPEPTPDPAADAATAPYALLDDGYAPDPCDLLVIGCGNILRGDDAVGPVLVRTLFERAVPPGVRLVDGGTAGMDVAFGMRGASRVVIVDASATGAPPGTVHRVPAEALTDLPPIDGLHSHNFRWDHALSFGAWLLGPERPTDVTVFLVEAGDLGPGQPLTAPVDAGMHTVIGLIERDFYPPTVEINVGGYLRLPAELAARHLPADVCVATAEPGALVLHPLRGAANGGLVLKQCNPRGDRSLLVHEVLGFAAPVGRFVVEWDEDRAALRVLLDGGADHDARQAPGSTRGGGRPDGGRARTGPVVGLPAGADLDRGGAPVAGDLPHGSAGAADGGRGPSLGGPTTTIRGEARSA